MRGWVWIGWILLIAAACTPQVAEPTLTPEAFVATNTPLPPQTFTATEAPISAEPTAVDYERFAGCPGAPPSRLIVQERGQVTPSDETLNLREGPGTDFDIRTRIEPEEYFFVIDGPECNGGYTWYQIRYRRFEGWIAEGDFDDYYAQPYLPG